MPRLLLIVGVGFTRAFHALQRANDTTSLSMNALPAAEGEIWSNRAECKVRAGLLRPLRDGEGAIIAYERTRKGQRLQDAEAARAAEVKAVAPEIDPSEASISVHEMNAFAGRHFRQGKSRTKGMSEIQRANRTVKQRELSDAEILAGARVKTEKLPAEDHVERVEEKVKSFHTQRHARNFLPMAEACAAAACAAGG